MDRRVKTSHYESFLTQQEVLGILMRYAKLAMAASKSIFLVLGLTLPSREDFTDKIQTLRAGGEKSTGIWQRYAVLDFM